MKDEDLKYECSECGKECGQVFATEEKNDKKNKTIWKCAKCFYKKYV